MQDIQARRHRRIVGPALGERARAGAHDSARLPLEAEPVNVSGWENEGGARRADRGAVPLGVTGAASRPAPGIDHSCAAPPGVARKAATNDRLSLPHRFHGDFAHPVSRMPHRLAISAVGAQRLLPQLSVPARRDTNRRGRNRRPTSLLYRGRTRERQCRRATAQ